MGTWTWSQEFPTRLEIIEPIKSKISDRLKFLTWEEKHLFGLQIAVEEALTNAIVHGNLEISSEEETRELLKKRLGQAPFRDRCVSISIMASASSIVITIKDEGPGFDPESVPDPTQEDNLEKTNGRGLLLMRSFMSAVVFQRCENTSGTCLTMTKHSSDPTPNS